MKAAWAVIVAAFVLGIVAGLSVSPYITPPNEEQVKSHERYQELQHNYWSALGQASRFSEQSQEK
jgi:hypothetical protein